MKVKELYVPLSAYAPYMLLEREDGTLFRFLRVPFRRLTEADLAPVITPLTRELYLKSSHTNTLQHDRGFIARQYGLAFSDEE